MIYVENIITER